MGFDGTHRAIAAESRPSSGVSKDNRHYGLPLKLWPVSLSEDKKHYLAYPKPYRQEESVTGTGWWWEQEHFFRWVVTEDGGH